MTKMTSVLKMLNNLMGSILICLVILIIIGGTGFVYIIRRNKKIEAIKMINHFDKLIMPRINNLKYYYYNNDIQVFYAYMVMSYIIKLNSYIDCKLVDPKLIDKFLYFDIEFINNSYLKPEIKCINNNNKYEKDSVIKGVINRYKNVFDGYERRHSTYNNV